MSTPAKFSRSLRKITGTSGTTYDIRKRGFGYEVTVGSGKDITSMGEFTYLEDAETAVDNADEEMRCLIADARAEFGF